MKASDFTTTSSQRDAASQTLLQTEQTDAVNSGLVGKADKSGSALKGNLYSVGKKAATGGAASAALSAVTKGRKAASGTGFSSATDASVSAADAGTVVSSKWGRRKTHSAQPGSSKGTSSGGSRRGGGRSSASSTSSGMAAKGGRFGESLKAGAKRAGKGAVLGAATRKTLEGTELEGADDLYYKGKGAYRIARGVKRRLSGKDAMQADKPLGQLSEKKSAKKAADAVDMQRRSQAASYFKRNVYTTATANAEKAATTVKLLPTAAAKGGGSGIVVAAAPFLPALFFGLIIFLFLIGIVGAVGGLTSGEGNNRSTGSLEGVPAEVASILKGYGYTNESIAAILGNMQHESSMNPGTAGDDGYGTVSIGLIQLTGANKNSFLRWCANNGKEWTSVSAQMEWSFSGEPGTGYYVDDWGVNLAEPPSYYRLERGYEERFGTDFYRDPNQLKPSTDVDLATYSWMACHERPGSAVSYGDDVSRLNRRLEYAHDFLAQLNNGGVGGGQDYASAEQWQKDLVDACHRTSWPGASLCATWAGNVYRSCGYQVWGNGNSMLGHQGYGASYYPSRATADLSEIKVGMLVSAQYGSNTAAGNAYGHVGIYIGDGQVMDSINTGIRTISLTDWVAQNNRGWVVCGYPWDWR